MNKQTMAIFALVIAQIFWGASYLLSDRALQVFPPATLTSIRIFIAACVLGLIGLATGQLKMIKLRDFKYFVFASFCEPFVYFLCEAESLTRVSPTVASVMLSFIPLLTPLFAFLIIRERVTLMNIVGIVVSVVGVLMIILNREGKLEINAIGLILLFIGVLASISYTLVLRKIPEGYNIITIVFFMFCTSLLFFIPSALVRENAIIKSIDFSASETIHALWFIVALALSSSCIAFLFFSYGVRTIGATRANVFNNIQPGVTAILSWFILGEALGWIKWLGIAVVIIGMFVSQIDMDRLKEKFRAKRFEKKIAK